MSWKIAMIVSLLGTAFFLVYVASQIVSDHWFQKFLKLFLILVSFAFIIQATGIPTYLLDANKITNSTTTCDSINQTYCVTTTTMNNASFNELKDNMGAALHTSSLIFRLLMWAFIFGFIVYVLEEMWALKIGRGKN